MRILFRSFKLWELENRQERFSIIDPTVRKGGGVDFAQFFVLLGWMTIVKLIITRRLQGTKNFKLIIFFMNLKPNLCIESECSKHSSHQPYVISYFIIKYIQTSICRVAADRNLLLINKSIMKLPASLQNIKSSESMKWGRYTVDLKMVVCI